MLQDRKKLVLAMLALLTLGGGCVTPPSRNNELDLTNSQRADQLQLEKLAKALVAQGLLANTKAVKRGTVYLDISQWVPIVGRAIGLSISIPNLQEAKAALQAYRKAASREKEPYVDTIIDMIDRRIKALEMPPPPPIDQAELDKLAKELSKATNIVASNGQKTDDGQYRNIVCWSFDIQYENNVENLEEAKNALQAYNAKASQDQKSHIDAVIIKITQKIKTLIPIKEDQAALEKLEKALQFCEGFASAASKKTANEQYQSIELWNFGIEQESSVPNLKAIKKAIVQYREEASQSQKMRADDIIKTIDQKIETLEDPQDPENRSEREDSLPPHTQQETETTLYKIFMALGFMEQSDDSTAGEITHQLIESTKEQIHDKVENETLEKIRNAEDKNGIGKCLDDFRPTFRRLSDLKEVLNKYKKEISSDSPLVISVDNMIEQITASVSQVGRAQIIQFLLVSEALKKEDLETYNIGNAYHYESLSTWTKDFEEKYVSNTEEEPQEDCVVEGLHDALSLYKKMLLYLKGPNEPDDVNNEPDDVNNKIISKECSTIQRWLERKEANVADELSDC